jgi:hypothetical protein
MGTTQVHETCLTAEKAKNPREDFFTGADKNCRYEHFKWGDGKIDLKMLCTHENATQTMELAGTYQPNNYKMAMSVASKGSNPAGKPDCSAEPLPATTSSFHPAFIPVLGGSRP